MSFVIETGVAHVSNRKGRKGTAFPLADMSVGSSFKIAFDITDKKLTESWRRKVLTAKKKFAKANPNTDFSTAVVSETKEDGTVETGLRVWRNK